MRMLQSIKIRCRDCHKAIEYLTNTGLLDEITEGNPRFPWEVNYECFYCGKKKSISEFEVLLQKVGFAHSVYGKIKSDDYEIWVEDLEGNRFNDNGELIHGKSSGEGTEHI